MVKIIVEFASTLNKKIARDNKNIIVEAVEKALLSVKNLNNKKLFAPRDISVYMTFREFILGT